MAEEVKTTPCPGCKSTQRVTKSVAQAPVQAPNGNVIQTVTDTFEACLGCGYVFTDTIKTKKTKVE